MNTSEQATIQGLAVQVAEIADSAEMEIRRQRWRDTYMLRKTDRAPVWLRPGTEWLREIVTEQDLECREPFARGLEFQLKAILAHHAFGDDSFILPYWKVAAAVRHEGEHLWGLEVKRHDSGFSGGAWSYDPPVHQESDLDRLRMPTWAYDQAETDRRLNRYAEYLGDALPVRVHCPLALFPGVARNASDLIGLDNLLINMALEPEFIHRLMAFVRDSVLQCIEQMEAMGVFTENNDEEIHFSESLKTSPPEVPVKASDLWLRTESQQFQNVSPAMWREFCLEYQKPIMSRFRYVSYGCCEDLTDRIDDVLAIPNLRIFVKSPWTDWRKTIEKCGDRYSIVWRQLATEVLSSDTLEAVAEKIAEGLRASRGCHRAIVLQELITANGHPERFHEWVKVARDASERFS